MDTSTPARPSEETVSVARHEVRRLLSDSAAFRALDPDTQREIARNTVAVASYLAEPDGVRVAGSGDPYAFPQADEVERVDQAAPPEFVAGAAREGVEQAGALLENVNFPTFVSELVNGVFHSIVQTSIQQMEAYGKLVADVAKSLNQFRDENVSVNQGRDQLVDTFPDVFEIDTGDGGGFFGGDGGDDLFGGEQQGPRVRLRQGVDEQQALQQVNASGLGTQVDDLSEESIEGQLVPAARTQLATSRQQLLATMVLMGINRIVVTDGKIQAKVLYDFRAKDNMRYQRSATSFDYGDKYTTDTESEWDTEQDIGAVKRSGKYNTDDYEYEREGSKYYTKGSYKYARKPVLTLASATQQAGDAALQTRASLAGVVDINFRSETFPLERMADSFQIGRIQNAAQPAAGAPGAAGGAAPGAGAQDGQAAQPAPGGQAPAGAVAGGG